MQQVFDQVMQFATESFSMASFGNASEKALQRRIG